jgi:hypothetical protein
MNPAAPGTNSLGTALSGGGAGGAIKGAEFGTGNPAVEDARVAKKVESRSAEAIYASHCARR